MLPDRRLSWTEEILLRLVCVASAVPRQNLVRRAEYEALLRSSGLKLRLYEDVTEHVFTGLAGFIDRRTEDEVGVVNVLSGSVWFKYRMFSKVLRWWARSGILHFVVVVADVVAKN